MKKVLFVNHCLSSGGSEKAMTLVANYFAEHGIDVTMILLNDEPKVYKVNDKINIEECYCPVEGNKIAWQYRRLHTIRDAVKRNNPDVIVTFMSENNARVIAATLGMGKYIVQSERCNPYVVSKMVKLAMKTIMKKADYTVFQTQQAREFYPKKIQRKSTIIANALPENLPEINRNVINKKIIAVGRFSQQKNFELLINAFSIFSKNVPEYRLVIYGDGPLRESLEKQVSLLGINESVKLPGYISNVIEELSDAAMYISTSNYEGISNAMLEAMAMGVPCICTDCPVGGARDMIVSDYNGILIPVGDEQRLVEAMTKIAGDDELASKISRHAVEIREKCSMDSIGKLWMEACKCDFNG